MRKAICIIALFLMEPLGALYQQAVEGPGWARDGVVYSVFPRSFSDKGNLDEVTRRLEWMHELGVNIIWLLPLQDTGELKKKGSFGSPYALRDYEKMNPAYGTAEDLKNLVRKAHQVGMKVIIDAVLNHTAWDCVLMSHPEWYRKGKDGQIVSPLPEWSDVAALDYTNHELQEYMLDLLKRWMREFNLDGFRFDASDFVPLEFWKRVRKELKKINPDCLLLGEGENPEALCVAFDLDYDWRFKRALDNIIMGGAPATATMKAVLEEEEHIFPQGGLHLRFSDNHDERRAIVRYGEKGALAASALIFTLNGVPLIYNGMEVGDATESCDPALFEKMPIFWNSEKIRPEFRSFYTQIIALRKDHPALKQGAIEWIENTSDERILTYKKVLGEDTVLVAINFSNQPFRGTMGPKKMPLELEAWEVRIIE